MAVPSLDEFVECLVCHEAFNVVHTNHLKVHGLSKRNYLGMFPDAEIISLGTRNRLRVGGIGNQNAVGFRHSIEFIESLRKSQLGNTNGRYTRGNRHTLETKAKMSLARVDGIIEGRINNVARTSRIVVQSSKMLRNVRCQSTYEIRALEILDRDPEVAAFEEQPLWMCYIDDDGHIRRYVPDFLILMSDGTLKLLEIKAEWEVSGRYNSVRNKFESALEYCDLNEMDFEVWTEEDLFR